MKNWIGLSLAAAALAVSASAGFACEDHAQAADANDPAKAPAQAVAAKAVPATDTAKGCDMPCCAQAKAAAGDQKAANDAAEKPCSAHEAKGCPKKAPTATAAAAKIEPAKDTAKAAPPASPGTNR